MSCAAVSTDPLPLADLPYHPDIFCNILMLLELKEVAYTRLVSKTWCSKGKKSATLYQIGLGNDGRHKWDADENEAFGWGMKLFVDFRGNIKGANKNTVVGQTSTAQEKRYTGKKTLDRITIEAKFPETEQCNIYEGELNGDSFKGRFKIVKSCGSRPVGSGGTMEGKVRVC